MRPVADWTTLRPLPRVALWNKGRKARTWEARRDDYAAMPMEPLVITAELVTPVIHAEQGRTHLDSILSFAAITTHPVASEYDKTAVIPLPLALAWVSPEGRPLWGCSPLMADGPATATKEYWHKRYPDHRAELGHKLTVNTTAGRWKEYRVPVHAQQTERLHAVCIGHATELEKLLAVVTHVGKKGSMGYGRVARWHVTPGAHTMEEVLDMRPVPIGYYAGDTPKGRLELGRAWTPPYWYAPLWTDCMVPQ
jgi:hypothetical protein